MKDLLIFFSKQSNYLFGDNLALGISFKDSWKPKSIVPIKKVSVVCIFVGIDFGTISVVDVLSYALLVLGETNGEDLNGRIYELHELEL